MPILVSKCLMGENCRYKGDNCKNEKVLDAVRGETVIAVCPEQDGGLSTPRPPAEIVGDKIVNAEGKDVTKEYLAGAANALRLAKENNVSLCILKAKSPSCGSGIVYDGSFTGKLTEGDGITAKLLKENGFRVISENDL